MKPSKVRRQLAWEAARLIHEQPDLRRSDALRSASERLCPQGVRPRDVPSNAEVNEQLRAQVRKGQATTWEQRFEHYAELLNPLASVMQDPQTHPEGDALYHSLQVFQLVAEQNAYDEELLTAALLHDVGLAIDRKQPLTASLAALAEIVTQRTLWFLENLAIAQQLLGGTLGIRARNRLETNEDFDEVILLAECDLAGRRRGLPVPEVEAALDTIRQLHEAGD